MPRFQQVLEVPVKGAVVTVDLTVTGPDLLIVANLMNTAFDKASEWLVSVTDKGVTEKDAVIELLQAKADAPALAAAVAAEVKP